MRDQTVGRERGEEKREEEKRKKEESSQGMETNLDYEFYEIWYGSYGICMIIILPKPRVLLGFHHNPKIMEIKVGKSHKEQDEYGIPLLDWIHG